MLDKLEVVDKPAEINDKMNIELNPSVISGNDVLSVSHLSKAFDDNTLLLTLALTLSAGNGLP